MSLPNDVGDGDGESSPAAKPDGLAPVDALRADIQVTKDSTQDGVAPADVVPLIQSLPAAPFTLQRLCEVVSARGGGVYKSRPKLAYALHRLASVTSTLQPVAVEDRWAQGSGGGLGGEGSDMAGALRLRRPLGEDTDEQADGSELSAAAAPAAGARTVSAKRPREGDDADGADPAAATDDGGRDGEAEPAASAQSGEAAGASRAGAAGPDSEQGPAKRPRPSQ